MNYLFALLIIAAAITVSLADKEEDEAFEIFKTKHGKKYNPGELAKRRSLFGRTHREIKRINSQRLGWEAGHNEFSDWTDEEMESLKGTRLPKKEDRSFLVAADDDFLEPMDRQTPAATVDYRNHTCMRPVKNQGQCGSCWAFAALTPLEFAQCNKSNVATSLSEQQLVSCDIGWGDYGCGGGFYSNAWNFLKNVTGSVKAASYPYTSGTTLTQGVCKAFNSSAVGARVSGWGWLPTNANATTIMARVRIGPVAVAINATSLFQSYSAGVFSDTTCNFGTFQNINHAVVIVGYGTASVGGDYWIVRNSWGTGWGMSGYILMKRGVNQCWIESWVRYPNLL